MEAGAQVGVGLQPPPVAGEVDLQPPPEAPASAPAEEGGTPWYEKLSVGAFIDTYFSMNYGLPKPQGGRNRFRAFDHNNGFSVAWGGLDIAYSGEEFGGTLDLRFGPSAARLAGVDVDNGLENVKQAFATWRPGGGIVTLDFGKFDTIVGAEAADSQLNFNYTRGYLFWLAQPFFHTGLRANFDVNDQFWITGLIANGWDNSVDNNFGKTFGVQFNYAMPGDSPLFDAHLAYVTGPEGQDWGQTPCPDPGTTFDPESRLCNTNVPDSSSLVARDAGDANTELRHLIDLVLGINPSPDFSMLLNADFGIDSVRTGPLNARLLAGFESQSWFGVSAAARLQFNEQWAGALRAELLSDPDARTTAGDDPYVVNVEDLMLYDVTLTAEVAPVENLILRLDNRLDISNEKVFQQQLRTYESIQFTSTLGAVVTTN